MAYKLDVELNEVLQIVEARNKTTLREGDANRRAYDALVAAQNGENNTQWGRRLYKLVRTENVPMTLTPFFVGSDNLGAILEGTPGHAIFSGVNAGRKALLTGWTNPVNNVTTLVSSSINPDKLYLGEHTGVASESDPNPRFQENPTATEELVIADIVDSMNAHNRVVTAINSDAQFFEEFTI